MSRILVLAALGRNPVSGAARPNRNDLLALELARELGGELSVLHAGKGEDDALRDYLAHGAPALDILPLGEGQDVAQALAGAATGYDLILAGTRAEGGEGSGMVPYLLAEQLGLPIVAQALEVTIADGHASITQGLAKGQRRHVRVALPAVVVVHPNAARAPRYAFARRAAGNLHHHPAAATAPAEVSPWRTERAGKRPIRFKAAETKAGHARMLSAIVTEAKGGAVVATGTAADKAQAILDYLRTHKLIDW